MTFAAPDLGHFETVGPVVVWILVLTFVFLECAFIIGLFLPGDTLLLTAGIALAGHASGTVQVWLLAAGAAIAAIAGNQVGYVIGHRSGHHLAARRNGRYFNTENLHRVNALLDRHGFWSVLVARWIPWVRTLCPLVAGAARMDHRRYTIASTLGALAWAPVLLLAGYYAGEFLERVSWLMPVVLAGAVGVLVVGTGIGVYQYRQEIAKPTEDYEVE